MPGDPGDEEAVVVDGETLVAFPGTFSVDETALTVSHRICGWGTDSEPGTEQATYTWEWDGARLTMTSEDDNCVPRERLFAELVPIDPLPAASGDWADTLGVVDLDQPVEWSRNGLALSVDRLFIADGDTFRAVARKHGPLLESHPLFPHKVNVDLTEVKSRSEIDLVVYERGCGITRACGTGACAATAAAAMVDKVDFDREVQVNLPGGSLFVRVEQDFASVWMRGPAVMVYRGELPGINSQA